MVRPTSALIAAACSVSSWAQPNPIGFVPGHVFVSEFQIEACWGKGFGNNWIREIDAVKNGRKQLNQHHQFGRRTAWRCD